MSGHFILDKRGLFLVEDGGSIIKMQSEFKIKRLCDQYGRYCICD
jgi:hypothetical protein